MPTPAHANLLAQMKSAADFWIRDHTVTDESGTKEDPAYPKRMAGFKSFRDNVDAELALIKTALGDRFSPDMVDGEEHAAYKLLAERYKGSAESLFTKAAYLIEKGVGASPGSSAKINIEFGLPVDPSGVGFIGGRLTIEASRDDKQMLRVRSEMTVSGGAKVGIAKIKAELGGYIESNAATARDAMNLYSYGLYRRFRESDAIPSGMTNYLWGGSRGSYGKSKSEGWSRDLEKQLFGLIPLPDQNDPKHKDLPEEERQSAYEKDLTDAQAAHEKVKAVYVETGGFASGQGELSLSSVVGMNVGIMGTTGRRINTASIVAAKGSVGAANTGFLFGQDKLGVSVSTKKAAASVKVPCFEGAIAVSSSGNDRTVEIEASGKVPAAADDKIPAYLTGLAVDIIKLYRAIRAAEGQPESLGPLMVLGSIYAKTNIMPQVGLVTRKGALGFVGDVGLKLVGTVERTDGKWEGSIELKHVPGMDVDLVSVLKVELEKQERLVKWTYGGGTWTASWWAAS